MPQALSIPKPTCRTLILGLLFASLALVSLRADPLDNWHLRNPLLPLEAISDVTFGGGLFVAVGDRGTIQTSPDGANWTLRHSDVSLGTLNGAVYGGDRFVVVSASGRIVSSTDGITWSDAPTVSGRYLLSVTYGDGKFVAVGDRDSIPYGGFSLVSSNGLDWSPGAFPNTLYFLTDVAFGNGTFVAAGNGGVTYFSTNGVNWVLRSTDVGMHFDGVAYGNGLFVAVSASGNIFTTANGLSWTERTNLNETFGEIAFSGSQFVAVGLFGGPLAVSSNALDWASVASPFPGSLNGIAFGNGTWVAAGEAGTVLTSTAPSQEGSWTSRNTLTTAVLDDVAFGDNLFVAVGDRGTVLTSETGSNWVLQASGTSNRLTAVAHQAGQFAAVGMSEIRLSSDGVHWEQAFANTNISFEQIASGNGMFITLGTDYANINELGFYDSPIYRSTDGHEWTRQVPGIFQPLGPLAYGNGVFVALATATDPAAVVLSSNGTSWTCHQLPKNLYPYALMFANGLFTVPGSSGYSAVSPDGVHWQQRIEQNQSVYSKIAYGGGQYATVGGGTLETSFGGIDWTNRSTPELQSIMSSLTDIVYGNGAFVAVGQNGVILQSDSLVDAPPAPPVVVESPKTATVRVGESVSFTAGATGSAPFRYQWRRNGVQIPGATNNVLFLSEVQTSAQGSYSVAISNDLGGMISQGALLIVIQLGPLDYWTVRHAGSAGLPGDYQNLKAVAYGNGQFVAMGDPNLLFTSSNGLIWSQRLLPSPFSGDNLAFGNGTFVALDTDEGQSSCSKIMSSRDGIAWTNWVGAIPPPSPLQQYICTPHAVAYGMDRFVAVGLNSIHVSSNAFNWNLAMSGLDMNLRAVAYGNGVFVAVGYDYDFGFNVILSSPDGFSWTFEDFDRSQLADFRDIAFGNGRFIVTGVSGAVFSSIDGIDWETHGLPQGLFPQLGPIAFGGGWFVAADADSYYGRIWTSHDGMTWAYRYLGETGFTGAIRDITFGQNTFLAVGDAGLMIQCDPLSNTPPAILRQPRSKTLHFGAATSLSLEAGGSSPMTYEWFKDGKALCVVFGSSLEFPSISLGQAGAYQVIVHNPYGSVTSAVAIVTVESDAPILSIQFDTVPRLTVLCQAGNLYRIECQDELSAFPDSWRTLDYVLPSISQFTWEDTESPPPAQRFYRVMRQDFP
jgi:hypothetical protein